VDAVLDEPPVIAARIDALVRQAQAGDRAAFGRLYRDHVGRVYAVCLRMVADGARAEQLTQDAFVRAWQTLASFRGDSAFSSWLYRIAVNTVLLDLRSARRRTARIEATDDLERFDQAGPGAPAEDVMDLEAGIAALPTQARTVLVLHDIEGYRHDEIAGLMGIAPGTSKAHLHRARQLLREVLNR
jgi:RNA polymerase sigma factor (sigma-70 family)